jgi:16S rRNA (guanine527-N7)-methyltransferase
VIASEDEARAWLRTELVVDDAAMERLDSLVAMLNDESARQNLVSAASLAAIWERHIVDSAQLLTFVPRETTATPWLDLGTGAGFPGLVIAVLRPDVELVMVESRRKRIVWLNAVVEALQLPNATVRGERVELIESRPMGVISARAFAPLDKLLDLSVRFSTSDTLWLLPKGRSARDEVEQLRGWQHAFHVKQSLTDADAGIIVGNLAGYPGKKVRQA